MIPALKPRRAAVSSNGRTKNNWIILKTFTGSRHYGWFDRECISRCGRSRITWLRVCSVHRNEDVGAAVVSHHLQRTPRGHTGQTSNHHPEAKGNSVNPFCNRFSELHFVLQRRFCSRFVKLAPIQKRQNQLLAGAVCNSVKDILSKRCR